MFLWTSDPTMRRGFAGMVAAGVIGLAAVAIAAASPERYRPPVDELEDYVREPLPPGFSVQHTDVDGPVYVGVDGLTLYIWPLNNLRNGHAGDRPNEPSQCGDVRQTTTTGLMSPYPGGLQLPDLDIRPTCVALWPPAYAADDAQPVGKWTIIARPDGRKQWAFEGQPVYRSALDKKPGQVIGSSRRWNRGDSGSHREPIGPRPNAPPAFAVHTVATGRLLTTVEGFSVYAWDRDVPNKSHCDGECLEQWRPVLASELSQSDGEWRIIERSRGIRQWTFRGRPLYTHIVDARPFSLEGGDVPGWHNVYAQKNPPIPAGFTIQDTRVGEALADKNGKTIYLYRCADDAPDQLDCDYPAATQAYRLAVCGRGDAARCGAMFPYVLAPADAKSNTLIWGTMDIDPVSGHAARPGDPRALHVWTFRDRPIYTHGLDKAPGEINGDGWGEYNGKRNGYKGFFLRDDFLNNAG